MQKHNIVISQLCFNFFVSLVINLQKKTNVNDIVRGIHVIVCENLSK